MTYLFCKKLRFVDFAENSILKIIEKNAFENTSIEHIKIPQFVMEIKRRTFLNCSKLKQLEFHKNSELNKINFFAFKSCMDISIVIPPHVTEISNSAFQYCYQIVAEIDENSQLKSIRKNMFNDVNFVIVFVPVNLNISIS